MSQIYVSARLQIRCQPELVQTHSPVLRRYVCWMPPKKDHQIVWCLSDLCKMIKRSWWVLNDGQSWTSYLYWLGQKPLWGRCRGLRVVAFVLSTYFVVVEERKNTSMGNDLIWNCTEIRAIPSQRFFVVCLRPCEQRPSLCLYITCPISLQSLCSSSVRVDIF